MPHHPTLIDGKAIAAATNAESTQQAAALAAKGVVPHMAIVLVGDYEPSRIYVTNKQRVAKAAGIKTTVHHEAATISEDALITLVKKLSADTAVHGVIVQMPLPAHINAGTVLDAVDPVKDIDGLTTANLGRLVAGLPSFVPCTPQGCMLLIKSVRNDLSGLHAVVIGRSRLVGKPLAELLVQHNCTVSIIHSKTVNPAAIARQADILCVAAGSPLMVTADWIKPGAIVIDVGINRVDGDIVGDVDFAAVATRAGAITPVPKGVGPMTIACLVRNTIYAAAQQNNLTLSGLDTPAA